jgi:flavin reductase (DIM6/NTAB) family NADH-FMN oxidoreductase RutF
MKRSIGASTIVFPAPVFIIGTYDKEGNPNMAAVAWGGICCSDPVSVAISLREATYSYGNVIARKSFTINIPSEKYIKEADYVGIASGKTENKFAVARLTPVKSTLVDAPYVAEFPFVLECSLLQTVKIGLHTQFIGEVKDIKVEEDALSSEGVPDIKKIKPFLFNPANRTYYGVGKYLADAFSVGKIKK